MPRLSAGSCTWGLTASIGIAGGLSLNIALDDAVTYPVICLPPETTATDTWFGHEVFGAAVRLEFLTSDTYEFDTGFGVLGTETDHITCEGHTAQVVIPVGPPVNPSDFFLHSPILSLSSSAVLTGTWTFSAVPQDVLEDSSVTAQPLQWTVTWAFSPVPDDTIDNPCKSEGSSELGCQNQSLGEDIPISGTAFSLHYQSDRQLGRAGADPVAISDAQDLGGWTLSVHPVTLNYGYSATTCNLISAGVPGGEQLTYGYDGPLLTTTSWTGTVAGNVSRVYNNNFWIASESIGGGTTVAFTYDNDGLLNKAGALTLNRTPTNGLITGTTLGAASDARTYNSFGELPAIPPPTRARRSTVSRLLATT
jgi:hypothetical protein